ncbi:MAG: hypothetical protein QNL77_02855 [Akkermansiaceae bacterium]
MGRDNFMAFWNDLPSSEQEEKAGELEGFERAHEKLKKEREALVLLERREIEAELKRSRVYEPIMIHGRAMLPRSAVFPNVTLELCWGLGRGAVFGVVVVLAARLWKRATKGGKRRREVEEVDWDESF